MRLRDEWERALTAKFSVFEDESACTVVALGNLDSIGHGKEIWFSDREKLVQKANDINGRIGGSKLIWTAVI